MDIDQLYRRYRLLQSYVGWTERDAEQVRSLAPLVAPDYESLIDDFYAQIYRQPETRKVLTGGDHQVARLKETLRSWLGGLLAGSYDRDYVHDRWKVGRRHVDIGLAQVFANVALARLRSKIVTIVEQKWGARPLLAETLRSLNKLIDLDLAIIGDAYQTEHASDLRHQSESAFRKLMQVAPCMIVLIRPDHTIVHFSSFAERLTGYSAAEVVGRDYFELFLPAQERLGVDEEVTRILHSSVECRNYENPIVCKDGSLRWMVWNANRLTEYDGDVAILAVGLDITERRQSEQERQLLSEAVKNLNDGVIITDAQLEWPGPRIVFLNDAMIQLTGYQRGELLGQTPRQLQGERSDRRVLKRLRKQLANGEVFRGEIANYRKDGTAYDVELFISPVRDETGAVAHYVSIHRDISERKLTQEKLLQAERLAAIGQTVMGLAHESRNAFQRSAACLEMLALEVEDQPEAMDLIGRIQMAQERIQYLYEDVRGYAAPIKLNCEPCALAKVIEDVWRDLVDNEQNRLSTLTQQPEIDTSCRVDRLRIEQVFRNIMENSIAASPGGVAVAVRYADVALDEKPAIKISIRDSGPGLSDQQRDKIFDPFYTTKTHGTGLGMPIARRIIEAHGGALEAGTSKPGAEFIITLPRDETG